MNATDVALKSKTLRNLELHNLKADARKMNIFDVCVCNKKLRTGSLQGVGYLVLSDTIELKKLLENSTVTNGCLKAWDYN